MSRAEDTAIFTRIKELIQEASHRRQMTDELKKYPMLTLTYAQSIDGSIALANGMPLALSSKDAMTITHMLRASHQGILIGINTLLSDDPALTVRLVEGDNPKPIIVDTHLRCPQSCKILTSASCVKPVILCGRIRDNDVHNKKVCLEQSGVTIIECDTVKSSNGKECVNLRHAFEILCEYGFKSIMIEGGSGIITSCLKEQVCLKLFLSLIIITIAPVFIGGANSINKIICDDAKQIPRLKIIQRMQLQDDTILIGHFR